MWIRPKTDKEKLSHLITTPVEVPQQEKASGVWLNSESLVAQCFCSTSMCCFSYCCFAPSDIIMRCSVCEGFWPLPLQLPLQFNQVVPDLLNCHWQTEGAGPGRTVGRALAQSRTALDTQGRSSKILWQNDATESLTWQRLQPQHQILHYFH